MVKRGEKKVGRPANYEKRKGGSLRTVGFRIDDETFDALERLAAALRATGVIHPRSVAIRRALLDADAKLTANGGKIES